MTGGGKSLRRPSAVQQQCLSRVSKSVHVRMSGRIGSRLVPVPNMYCCCWCTGMYRLFSLTFALFMTIHQLITSSATTRRTTEERQLLCKNKSELLFMKKCWCQPGWESNVVGTAAAGGINCVLPILKHDNCVCEPFDLKRSFLTNYSWHHSEGYRCEALCRYNSQVGVPRLVHVLCPTILFIMKMVSIFIIFCIMMNNNVN